MLQQDADRRLVLLLGHRIYHLHERFSVHPTIGYYALFCGHLFIRIGDARLYSLWIEVLLDEGEVARFIKPMAEAKLVVRDPILRATQIEFM